ncbi:MAG: DNA-binding LacI/PurR family transcriptional regulator [Cryomorphaceae bacterium]|jgi:DNA-binding LacI/PurR family transcriptional regulator
MKLLRVLTATEQVADHLREKIIGRTWGETMPGTSKLAVELGVGMRTVSDALKQLESEGLLVSQGRRRKRRIVVPDNLGSRGLRIAILLCDPNAKEYNVCTNLLLRLVEAGYHATFCTKTLCDLGMDVAKVRRYAKTIHADAWIVFAGSDEVLDWFSKQPIPTFAIGGRHTEKEMAATAVNTTNAMKLLLRRLVALGHRRIVFLTLEDRIKPHLAVLEQCFLDELESLGIQTGPYNIPEWSIDSEGLHQCLDSLFKVTPPTAIYCMKASIYHSVSQYLSQQGIAIPGDVSLICSHSDRGFYLCRPSVAHNTWDPRKLHRATIKWVNKVARGINDKRKIEIQAEFIEAGTIGPAPTKVTIGLNTKGSKPE